MLRRVRRFPQAAVYGKAAGGSPPAGAAYSFLQIVSPDTSAVSNVITVPINFGAASANRVIVIGNAIQQGQVINSIVIDPSGTPVSLGGVVTDPEAFTSIWSGVDATHSGTTNVQFTFATSINFNNFSVSAWQATGLGSTSFRQKMSKNSAGDTADITVASTDFLFAMSFTGGDAGATYASSTVAPLINHQDSPNHNGSSADWTIAPANAGTFAITPEPGVGRNFSAATWR